jgi:ParB family chromosome partitioning protein
MVGKIAAPLELSLQQIEEDPNQPRKQDSPGFSAGSLGELAATIRERGVKSPISVREHPSSKGMYLINHGARRFRASKLAGKSTIPAFIDNEYSEIDQVIENLQRNELTAREIADFVGRELAKGKKKGEIAKQLGKSPAFITQHANLLDLPEPIAAAFNGGRARDVTVVNELLTAFKKDPGVVSAWLDDETQELTRTSVKLLREFLEDKRQEEQRDDFALMSLGDDGDAGGLDQAFEMGVPDPIIGAPVKAVDPGRLKKAVVRVRYKQKLAQLLTQRRPKAKGWAWIRFDESGAETEVRLAGVELVAVEGR